jgi:hypothetical protein
MDLTNIYMRGSKCTKIKFEVAIVSTSIHIEFKQKKGDELVMIVEFDCAEEFYCAKIEEKSEVKLILVGQFALFNQLSLQALKLVGLYLLLLVY